MRVFIGKRAAAVCVAALAMGICGMAGIFEPAWAADVPSEVTYTKNVLPILQENCQECHRSFGANFGGMVAPMAFTSYRETRPWAKAMAKAVAKLGISVDCVLVDGNFAPKISGCEVQCIVGGDNKIACISAGSIIAKVERDFVMAQYARQFSYYRFDRHKGYGTKQHLAELKRHGICRLHRRTFKPIKYLAQPGLFQR